MSTLIRVAIATGLLSHGVYGSSLPYFGNTISDITVTETTTNTHYVCPCDTTTSTGPLPTTSGRSEEWSKWMSSTSRSSSSDESTHGTASWTSSAETTSWSTSVSGNSTTLSTPTSSVTLSSTTKSTTSDITSTTASSTPAETTTSISSERTSELTSTTSQVSSHTSELSTTTPQVSTTTSTVSSTTSELSTTTSEHSSSALSTSTSSESTSELSSTTSELPSTTSETTTSTTTSETSTITSAPTTTTSTADICTTSILTVTIYKRDDINQYKHLRPRFLDEKRTLIAITPTNCASSTTTTLTTTPPVTTETTSSETTTTLSTTSTTTSECSYPAPSAGCSGQIVEASGKYFAESCNAIPDSYSSTPLTGHIHGFNDCINACVDLSDCNGVVYNPDAATCNIYNLPSSYAVTDFGIGNQKFAYLIDRDLCPAPLASSTTSVMTTTAMTSSMATSETTTSSTTTEASQCFPTEIPDTCQDLSLFANGAYIYRERCNIRLNPVNAVLNGAGVTTESLSTCVGLCSADASCAILSREPETGLCKLYDSLTGFSATTTSVITAFKQDSNPCPIDEASPTTTQSTTASPTPVTTTTTTPVETTSTTATTTPPATTTTSVPTGFCANGAPPSSTYTANNGDIWGTCTDSDWYGNNLGVIYADSMEDCIEACLNTPNCVAVSRVHEPPAFSVRRDPGYCYFKPARYEAVSDVSVDSAYLLSHAAAPEAPTSPTEATPTPACSPLLNGDFEEGSTDWSIRIQGADAESGFISNGDIPGYTTPYGSSFALLRYKDTVGIGIANQPLTEMYGTYSVSFSWSIPSMTNRGGDNPYCMVSLSYGDDYFTTVMSNIPIGWTGEVATFTAPEGVSAADFEVRPFCNPGAQGYCDCDVLVDEIVISSVNASCAVGGGGDAPAGRARLV